MLSQTLILLPSLAGAMLSIGVMLFAGVRRTGPGWPYVVAMGVGVALWCVAQSLWLVSDTVAAALRVNQVQYIAITLTPVMWFWLALAQTGRASWLRLPYMLPLLVLPATIIAAGFSYEPGAYSLLWRGIVMPPESAVPKVLYGPLFWLMAAYCYLLFLSGSLLMFLHFAQSPHYRLQRNIIGVLPAGVLVLNALFITGHWPLPSDPTPLGFAIGFAMLLWASSRGRMFELSPVGRSAAFDCLAEGVLILDSSDRIADMNVAASRLLSRSIRDTLGRRLDELLPQASVALALAGRQELRLERAADVLRLQVDGARIRNGKGEPIGVLLTLRDVTPERTASEALLETRQRLETANSELERMAHTDMLTGLANRRLLLARLDMEFSRARRHGVPLTLLMIDLDFFKQVNDTRGHLVGDAVLRRIGAELRALTRPEDIPARYGGEELALLLTDTGADGARTAAVRVWESLRGLAHTDPAGPPFRVTCCIGVALLHPTDTEANDLIARADAALYAAKAAGRDCVMLETDGAMERHPRRG